MLSDPRAQELLLRLLEVREFRVTRHALTDHYGAPGLQLLQAGLLEVSGHGNTVIASDEDDLPLYEVIHDRDLGLGYRSSFRGWVGVSQQELEIYRPRLPSIFAALFNGELRLPRQGMMELEQDLVWELGQLRLVKRGMTTIWFARRLYDRSAQDQLVKLNDRLPASSHRLILTSTPQHQSPELRLPGSTIVSIGDVLEPYKGFLIDQNRLRARFTATAPVPFGEVVHLSDDSATLTIMGTQIAFGGTSQRKAIRIIVDAHKAGRGVNAAQTLTDAGFGAGTRLFTQAFKKQWPDLKQFLKSHDGLWRFEF